MKDKLKGLWWIWPLLNTIAIILCFGCININSQISNKIQEDIDQCRNDIDKVEYRMEAPDSVIIINNIYVNEKRKKK